LKAKRGNKFKGKGQNKKNSGGQSGNKQWKPFKKGDKGHSSQGQKGPIKGIQKQGKGGQRLRGPKGHFKKRTISGKGSKNRGSKKKA